MSEASSTQRFRGALEKGGSFTRVEACSRFGFTGSTFRWAISTLANSGLELEFDLEPGGRGNKCKRWHLSERELRRLSKDSSS
jgi:hypothetical protein